MRAIRCALAAAPPSAPVAAAADRAAEDSRYIAFENRFPRLPRRRSASAWPAMSTCSPGLAPVVDLGCGRGEFLTSLRERGIAARGVEGNATAALELP